MNDNQKAIFEKMMKVMEFNLSNNTSPVYEVLKKMLGKEAKGISLFKEAAEYRISSLTIDEAVESLSSDCDLANSKSDEVVYLEEADAYYINSEPTIDGGEVQVLYDSKGNILKQGVFFLGLAGRGFVIEDGDFSVRKGVGYLIDGKGAKLAENIETCGAFVSGDGDVVFKKDDLMMYLNRDVEDSKIAFNSFIEHHKTNIENNPDVDYMVENEVVDFCNLFVRQLDFLENNTKEGIVRNLESLKFKNSDIATAECT